MNTFLKNQKLECSGYDNIYRKKKPTVCFFTTESKPGGTATSTKIIIDNLNKNKIIVKGVSAVNSEIAERIMENVSQYDTLNMSPFPQIKGLYRGKIRVNYFRAAALVSWLFVLILRLRRWLKRNSVDIVHTNSLHANCIAGIASVGLKTSSVWHIRAPQTQSIQRGGSFLVEGYLASWLAEKFIANSAFTMRSFHKSWSKKAIKISNAINVEYIEKNQRAGQLKSRIGIGEETKLVGLTGLISHRKGMDRFVEMAAMVAKKLPDTHFVVIGGAHNKISEKFRDELIDRIKKIEMDDRIHLIGDLEQAPLFASDMDVFFMCSRPGTETFGLVVVEAMAAGVPVVAFENDAMPEIITSGINGFLVAEGDIQSGAERVIKILMDSDLAGRIQKRASEDVMRMFDKSRLSREIEVLYDSILQPG